jgi:DNA-binding CsgD family transcriptional regulator
VDVLSLMMEGKGNKAICRVLNLAQPTVKNHVTAILKVLGVSNRTEAVNFSWRTGLEVAASLQIVGRAAIRPSDVSVQFTRSHRTWLSPHACALLRNRPAIARNIIGCTGLCRDGGRSLRFAQPLRRSVAARHKGRDRPVCPSLEDDRAGVHWLTITTF